MESQQFDVFLCHNSEDKSAVKKIAKRLRERGITPWLDDWDVQPGKYFYDVFEEQIEQFRSVAVFIGRSGTGPWQRLEIIAFLDELIKRGCPRIPVLLPGAPKDLELPPLLRGANKVDFRLETSQPFERLVWGITGKRPDSILEIQDLNESEEGITTLSDKFSSYRKRALGDLIDVPKQPPNFLPRDAELKKLLDIVLKAEKEPEKYKTSSITVSVQGMGGLGKSVITAELVRDASVREKFPHGIFWLTLGQSPNLLLLQTRLAQRMDNSTPSFTDIEDGRNELQRLWADKRGLLILDDVWKLEHLDCLNVLGDKSQLIITTRDANIATGIGAENYALGLLEPSQSLSLLSKWAKQAEQLLPPEAVRVAKECGNLPLALAMAGAMVQGKPDRWSSILKRLENADLDKIKQKFPSYPYPNLLKMIQVSIEALEIEEQELYKELVIFPEDIDIPQPVIERYCSIKGIDALDVEDTLILLADRSLLSRDNQGRIRLHDLLQDYLRMQFPKPQKLHQRLIDVYESQGNEDNYYWENWAYHFSKAQRENQLRSKLLDSQFLQMKLNATNVNSLLRDFGYVEDQAPSLLADSIRMSAHVLAQEPGQLAARLQGHLLGNQNSEIQSFLKTATPIGKDYWLRPTNAILSSPGGPLIRTFKGHSSAVNAVYLFKDGVRAMTASQDRTLKIWDLETGNVLEDFYNYGAAIHHISVSADETKVLSGTADKTLILWDLEAGEAVKAFGELKNKIKSVCLNSDATKAFVLSPPESLVIPRSNMGRDEMIDDDCPAIWDLKSEIIVGYLRGHSSTISFLRKNASGTRVLTGSTDDTLMLWDMRTGKLLKTLIDKTENGLTATPYNGCLNADATRALSVHLRHLTYWDLESDVILKKIDIKGNSLINFNSLDMNFDGTKVICGSSDGSIQVWDLDLEQKIKSLDAHSSHILDVTLNFDCSQALSCSSDNTLKLWNLDLASNEHRDRRNCYLMCFSIGNHGTLALKAGVFFLELWNLDNNKLFREFSGLKNSGFKGFDSISINADGTRVLASMGADAEPGLILWNLKTGEVLRKIISRTKDTGSVVFNGERIKSASLPPPSEWFCLANISADGRKALSGSVDGTIKLWDLESGEEIRSVSGHGNKPLFLCFSFDENQALSGDRDCTLKLWDLRKGKEIRTFVGHQSPILSVAIDKTRNHVLSGSADGKLNLWDLKTDSPLRTFGVSGDCVSFVCLSDDGTRALSLSGQSIRLWNLVTGQEISSFFGDHRFLSCSFIDSSTILAGDNSGQTYFFSVEKLH